jgi:hypothetical protein
MDTTDPDRRNDLERRTLPDRRSGVDRRAPRGAADTATPPERRAGDDRRKGERRLGVERRMALQSTSEQIHAALALLTRLVDTGRVDDDGRRFVDAALLRLKFALDRLGQT